MSDAITLAAAARTYVRAGWPVFPLQPRTKVPFKGSHGFEDASTDLGQITEWWRRHPNANIGTPTGVKVDSLDVDARKEGDGFDNLARLSRAGLLSGCIARQQTRNAGEQWLFPAADPPQACTSIRGQYIDIKASGGYIVLPPSVVPADEGTAGTGRYLWIEFDTTSEGSPLDAEAVKRFLRPPPARTSHHTTSRAAGPGIAGLVGKVAREAPGNRNNLLFWAARKALADGLALDELREAALNVGLRPSEVEATLASARRWVT